MTDMLIFLDAGGRKGLYTYSKAASSVLYVPSCTVSEGFLLPTIGHFSVEAEG